ncbi:hypothetical protein JST97_28190 [bacterium]|nr:hypothetical protein [bacterium]
MKNCILMLALCGLAWARPGLTASEARALSQGRVTFKEVCRKPNDQIREQLSFTPSQFSLTDLKVENGNWFSQRQSGQARVPLPPSLRGHIVQIQLDATFIQGEARFFSSDEQAQPCEEILTFHVPSWEEGCEHCLSQRTHVMATSSLTFILPAHSRMRLRRLLVQALN